MIHVADIRQRLRRTAQSWSGRPGAIFLLVSATIAGALIGAVLRPPPSYPQRAEAIVLVPHAASALGSTAKERVKTLSAALTTAPAMTAIKLAAGSPTLGSLSGTIKVRSNPGHGSLTVTADSETSSDATALANAAGAYAIILARRVQATATTPASIPASDFGQGIGSWSEASQFALHPLSETAAAAGGRYKDGSLVVRCQAKTGCGTGTSVQLAAIPHDTYTGAVWIRALSPKIRIYAFIGGSPADVATGKPALLTSHWRRLTASWTAHRQHPAIEMGVLTTTPHAGRFVLDAASVTSGPTPPSEVQERALASDTAAATALPAQAVGTVPVTTLGGAILGALAGLLAGLAGCAAGYAARCRQHAAQQ
jgi:hypothetical protein